MGKLIAICLAFLVLSMHTSLPVSAERAEEMNERVFGPLLTGKLVKPTASLATEEYRPHTNNKQLSARVDNLGDAGLTFLVVGLVVLTIRAAVYAAEIAAKKYTEWEIEKAHHKSETARVDFCKTLNNVFIHQELQSRVADLFVTLMQEKASALDQSMDVAEPVLSGLATKMEVTLKYLNAKQNFAARVKADEVCGGIISPESSGEPYPPEYWERRLKDPELGIGEDVFNLIVGLAADASFGFSFLPGSISIASMKVLKTAFQNWHSDAFAKMMALGVARTTAMVLIRIFIPVVWLGISIVDAAWAIGKLSHNLGHYWEKIMQAHSTAQKDVLNYAFMLCTILKHTATTEAERNEMLQSLYEALDMDEDLPMLEPPALISPVELFADASSRLDMLVPGVADAEEHDWKTLLALKEVCAVVLFHASAFTEEYVGSLKTECESIVEEPISQFKLDIEPIIEELSSKEWTHSKDQFQEHCPNYGRVLADGEDLLFVKELLSIPPDFFKKDRRDGVMRMILAEQLYREKTYRLSDSTDQGLYDPTKDLTKSLIYSAKDADMDALAITDLFRVPVQKEFIEMLKKENDWENTPFMALRGWQIAGAVDWSSPELAGISKEDLADSMQPVGIPCWLTRAAFTSGEHLKENFMIEWKNAFGGSPSGKIGQKDENGTVHWTYPEEASRTVPSDRETCYGVVHDSESHWYSTNSPFMLFAQRSVGAPLSTVSTFPKKQPKESSQIYASQVPELSSYLYYTKFDVKEASDS